MSRRIIVVLLAACLVCTPGRQAASGPEHPESTRLPRPARKDAVGDPLPPAAVARLGSLRLHHGSSISALAFLRDGKTLLSLGDGVLRAWQTATGKEVPFPVAAPASCANLVLSPDGRLLATVSNDNEVCLVDLETRLIVRQWSLGKGYSGTLAISPNNRLVAWADSSTNIHLHDVTTNREARLLKGHVETASALAFSPDGKSLASISRCDGILLWNLAAGKKSRRYLPPHGQPYLWPGAGVSFSRDGGSLLAANHRGHIIASATDSIEEQFKVTFEQRHSLCLAVSGDGKTFATAALDGAIKLWDIKTGKAIRAITVGTNAFTNCTLCFAAGGETLAVGHYDGTICLYDPTTGKELLERRSSEPLATAGFSLDEKEVITVQTSRLVHWSAATGKELGKIALSGPTIIGAALSPDRKFLALAREDKPVALLDVQKGSERGQSKTSYKKEVALLFTPDSGQLACLGALDPTVVRLWSVPSGKEVAVLQTAGSADGSGFDLLVHHDGRTLYGVGQRSSSIVRWEMVSGQQRGVLRLPTALLSGQPNLNLVFGGLRGGMGRMESTAAPRLRTALSQDSRFLALCRGELLYLIDLRTEQVVRCFFGATASLTSVAFSSDGRLLAAGGEDRRVRLWDVRSGALLANLEGHRGNVTGIVFSASGNRMLSTSLDGTVLVWDVAEVLRLPAPASRAESTRSLETLWADLASADASVADKAQRELQERPGLSLPFLARLLPAVQAVEPTRLRRLIADLDSGNLRQREEASAELERLDDLALPALRQARESASAEVRRRAERLLERLDAPVITAARARPIRIVELLEQVGTAAARKILEELARGAVDARLTQEATKSLQRLKAR